MKGRGKDDGKTVGPLFPRLHVNDTLKGGPRPPPRNKMALYEQLYKPSQRPANASGPMLPHPPTYRGIGTNVASSSQGVGKEKRGFSSLQSSPGPCNSTGRHGAYSTDGLLNQRCGELINRSMMISHNGNSTVVESLLPAVEYSSSQPCNISQFKWPSIQRNEREINFPTFLHPGLSLGSGSNPLTLNKGMYFTGKSSSKLQAATARMPNISNAADQESHKIPYGEGLEMPLASEVHGSLNNQYKGGEPTKPTIVNNGSHVEAAMQVEMYPCCDATEQPKVLAMNTASILRNEFCSQPPMRTNGHHSSLNEVGNEIQHREGNGHFRMASTVEKSNQGAEENGDCFHSHVKDESRATTMEGCLPHLVTSPDDVVSLIGQNHFWKARSQIIDQQRLFSMQLFELHRIIKVQRLLAGSANLLLEKNLSSEKAFSEPNHVKELPSNLVPEPPCSFNNLRNDVSKNEATAGNLHEMAPPLPPYNHEPVVLPDRVPHSGKPVALFPSLDEKLSMWCLLPSGTQWLVPVMSPSDGLIYKPYSGPSPPARSFLATLHGSCGPSNVTLSGGDFAKLPFSVHPGAPPMAPTYFAPYGMPTLNLSLSTPTTEQIVAKQDSNFLHAPHQSSYVIEGDVGEALESKDSENQESTASTPRRRPSSDDALPLFPTAPTA